MLPSLESFLTVSFIVICFIIQNNNNFLEFSKNKGKVKMPLWNKEKCDKISMLLTNHKKLQALKFKDMIQSPKLSAPTCQSCAMRGWFLHSAKLNCLSSAVIWTDFGRLRCRQQSGLVPATLDLSSKMPVQYKSLDLH